jgi:hypothetical protein
MLKVMHIKEVPCTLTRTTLYIYACYLTLGECEQNSILEARIEMMSTTNYVMHTNSYTCSNHTNNQSTTCNYQGFATLTTTYRNHSTTCNYQGFATLKTFWSGFASDDTIKQSSIFENTSYCTSIFKVRIKAIRFGRV